MRIVADTNVLVSALVFPGGAPEAVYRAVIERRVELVTSRPLLSELGRVLQTKFDWEPELVEQAVAQVIRLSTVVEPVEEVDAIKVDPADNRVLEAAAAGEAEMIVSGDRHLLKLGAWRGTPVKAPAEAVALIGA